MTEQVINGEERVKMLERLKKLLADGEQYKEYIDKEVCPPRLSISQGALWASELTRSRKASTSLNTRLMLSSCDARRDQKPGSQAAERHASIRTDTALLT